MSIWADSNNWAAVSAIGGAVSAVAALATVWHARNASAEARNAGRPYFLLEAPGFKAQQPPPGFRLLLPLKNIGARPAIRVEGRIYIATKSEPSEVVLDQNFAIGNAVPPNSLTPWYNDDVHLPLNTPPHFVLLGIEYVDPMTGVRHRQPFYMRWDGVKNGATQPDFVHVTHHERSEIDRQFHAVIHPYEGDA